MFDAIGVSERTQKPWTVVVSFIGQMAMIGMAILVPLVGTDALPHRLSWVSSAGAAARLAAPARRRRRRSGPAWSRRSSHRRGWCCRRRFHRRPRSFRMPTSCRPWATGWECREAFGNSNGTGNGVIDSLLASTMPSPPPPRPVVKPAAPPAPPTRIRLGGIVEEGKLISGPRPVYPPLARRRASRGPCGWRRSSRAKARS